MAGGTAAAAGPERFEIAIGQADLDDLSERLRRTRWAPDFGNDDWSFGVPGGYLHELVEHWLSRYDWRAHEAAMNAWEHWRVAVDGVPIHYLRVPGRGPDPLPLILTHGWPWTFWDYRHLLGPLTDPAAHGGDPADAFELIVPSLPGYTFSTPMTVSGVSFARTAELWHRLMRDVLGFERYGAGGGDWGAFVTADLAHTNPEGLVGAYLTFPALLGADLAGLSPDAYAADEVGWFEQTAAGLAVSGSHMAVHTADPQTLAYAMADSPVGQASWMLERRRAWSDCGGDVERRFSKDDLITSFALYWLTNSFASAVRLYAESFRTPWTARHDRTPVLQAPTGIAVYPHEIVLAPRALAERFANLVHWTVMPRGGHFAPAEEPELYVQDVRAFYRPLRAR
ncbi:MAG TPA: epoxide hydrolase [Mycobacteriales bacterium]|nr:epoxide hydrolase [Mycobacteriales bacterium]